MQAVTQLHAQMIDPSIILHGTDAMLTLQKSQWANMALDNNLKDVRAMWFTFWDAHHTLDASSSKVLPKSTPTSNVIILVASFIPAFNFTPTDLPRDRMGDQPMDRPMDEPGPAYNRDRARLGDGESEEDIEDNNHIEWNEAWMDCPETKEKLREV